MDNVIKNELLTLAKTVATALTNAIANIANRGIELSSNAFVKILAVLITPVKNLLDALIEKIPVSKDE